MNNGSLFSLQGGYQVAGAAMIPVFTQINPLPGAHQQFALADGNGQIVTNQTGFDVGRHVVGPFVSMQVIRRVLRHHLVEMALQIRTHCWVGIFIDGEAGAGVLDKQVKLAHLQLLNLWQLVDNFVGDQVKTSAFGR